jgi:polysaccharide biosynthesis transport protein
MKHDARQDGYPVGPARPEPEPGEDDEGGLDLRAQIRKIWRGKWIIATTTLIAWLAALLVTTEYDPVYRATAKVMFTLERANIMNIEALVVSTGVNENTIQNQIQILQSKALMERVVDRLDLTSDPEFNPFLREPSPPGLMQRIRGAVAVPPELSDLLQEYGVLNPPAPAAPEPDPEARAALERQIAVSTLSRGLTLLPIPGTRVIDISFTAGSPEIAARVANAVADQYIVDQLDARLEATRAAGSWLADRVEELRIRVQTAEEAVEAARARIAEASGETPAVTQQQLSALTTALTIATNDVRVAQAAYDRVALAGTEARDLASVPEFRSSELLGSLRAEEATLRAEASQLGGNNPRLIRINDRIEDLRNQMQEEARRIKDALAADLETKQERRAVILQDIQALEARAQLQSQEEISIRQLDREAQASRTLYQSFLTRLEETTAQGDLQIADARILSAAEVPLAPLAQAEQRTKTFALVAGVAGGIGLIFLMDKLNNTFRSPAQLEQMTGEVVIGTIPSIGRRFGKADVLKHFGAHPKGSLAESVRSLRTSILFSDVDNPPRVVMFTSSVPREGKSTTSVLVAMTSQQMGKAAVIVDCDLRLPALARLLGAHDESPGLLSLLEGSATLEEALFRDKATGLDVLMTKPSEPRSSLNAADVLASKKFKDLIAELCERYELVILDAPPTLVVADARILSRVADAVIYAVRWDKTPRGAVLEGLKELRTVNAPVAGVAFTMINEDRAMRYAYEGYAYYKGQYKDYYVS